MNTQGNINTDKLEILQTVGKKIIIEIVETQRKIQLNKTLSVAEHDNVQYLFLLLNYDRDFHRNFFINIKDHAHAQLSFCYFGTKNIYVNVDCKIGHQALVDYETICFAAGNQQCFFDEKYQFIAPGGRGYFNMHSLVNQTANSSYKGKIVIEKQARQADGRLDVVAYVLSARAHSHVLPSLSVKVDDVKAIHTAKVSPISAEQLFYLQTRGVKGTAVKKLIADGVLAILINKLTDKNLQNKILKAATKKI